MPILQQIGLDSGQPQVMDIHKVIVPAKKAAAPKQRKKASAPVRRRR